METIWFAKLQHLLSGSLRKKFANSTYRFVQQSRTNTTSSVRSSGFRSHATAYSCVVLGELLDSLRPHLPKEGSNTSVFMRIKVNHSEESAVPWWALSACLDLFAPSVALPKRPRGFGGPVFCFVFNHFIYAKL